jgi:aminotransferase
MSEQRTYTIIIFAENKPGVLYRIADLFLRRKINIESLTVSEIEKQGISRFTIVICVNREMVEKIVKQLYRIIEIIKVFEKTDDALVFKELAFIKVSTKNPNERREVEDLAYLFHAKVHFVGRDFLIIEKTGSEEEINSLYALLRPFGIREFVRSGRIAVLKEETRMVGKFSQIVRDPADVISTIDVSTIKKIQLMASGEKGVISLAQGIPSFFTPVHIKQAAKYAIDKNMVDKYTSGYGIQPLREAITRKLKKDNNIKADISEIIVTHGAIEALMAVFMTLLNPSDEVIVLTPDYASHITQTRIARHGGIPVFVPLTETEDSWVLDYEKIEARITQHTKAILVCNPCNPTGKVYTRGELKEIARIANKYNLFIITDEMYEYFTFDEKSHLSIGSFEEVKDRTISIFGVSKSYAMTGWRIGYIVANKHIITNIFKVHDALITCPTVVSQYAALAAITGEQSIVREFKDAFTKRRQIVIDALAKSTKMKLIVPEGTYYAFVKYNFGVDDEALAIRLMREAKVAVVPGNAFGLGGENHVRISFGGDEKELEEGMKRFVRFIEKNF